MGPGRSLPPTLTCVTGFSPFLTPLPLHGYQASLCRVAVLLRALVAMTRNPPVTRHFLHVPLRISAGVDVWVAHGYHAETENSLEFVRTFWNRLELIGTVWILLESVGGVVYGTVKPVQLFWT